MPKVKVTLSEKALELWRAAAEQNCRTLSQEMEFRAGTLGDHLGTTEAPRGATEGPLGATEAPKRDRWEPAEDEPSEPSFEELIADADDMDASGDIAKKDSPAQLRRKMQIAALQAAWAELFPSQHPLQPERAKAWLVLSDNQASLVFEQMQRTQARGSEVRNPVSYTEVALSKARTRREAERKKANLIVGPGGVILHDITPEELAADEEAKRILIEMGDWSEESAQWTE